jgi:hypothetical protein
MKARATKVRNLRMGLHGRGWRSLFPASLTPAVIWQGILRLHFANYACCEIPTQADHQVHELMSHCTATDSSSRRVIDVECEDQLVSGSGSAW